MTNVVPLQPHLNRYFPQESDLYFPIWERPVAFLGKDGYPYKNPKYKAIVRISQPSNKPIQIGMVGHNYKVLRMKDLCTQIEKQLTESLEHKELDRVKVVDQISYNGAMLFRQYIFRNLKVDISDRSDSMFRVIVVNSYDGSTCFKMYCGSINSYCSNGQISGIYDMYIKRHTSGLAIPNLVDRIRSSIDVFFNQAETFKKWVGKTITDEEAREVFEAIPNVSERRINQLMVHFDMEKKDHGSTVWALYNAATFYASHNEGLFSIKDTTNDTTAATLLNREKQISRWEKSEQFQQLAA